jgi:hypothetical protein
VPYGRPAAIHNTFKAIDPRITRLPNLRPMEKTFRRWLYKGPYRGDMRGLRNLAYRDSESVDILKRLSARGFITPRGVVPRVTVKGYLALLAHCYLWDKA